MVDIAIGYNRLAIELHQHFSQYKPGNWIETVSSVAPIPSFSPNTVKTFMQAHKAGKLESELQRLENSGQTPFEQSELEQLKPWYVKDTIQDFFNKELYKSYESELKMGTVLLVEDCTIHRVPLKSLLEKVGYFVCIAEDGLQGAAKAILENPDIIIADQNMPRMNGVDMIKQLKKYKPTSKIPIIGFGDFEEQDKQYLNSSYTKNGLSQLPKIVENVKELLS